MDLQLSHVERIFSYMEPTWPTPEEVSEAVKRALVHKGLSQRAAAELAGISPTTLNRRLTHGKSFTYDELSAVAKVVGRPVSSLLMEAECLHAQAGAA